jgi:hypothetical protein
MSGDWAGQRSTLAGWGITPTLTYMSDVLGNPVGGKRRGIVYDDNIGVDIDVNLEQWANLEGLVFHVSGSLRSGANLSTTAIGNTFIVSKRIFSLSVRSATCITSKRSLPNCPVPTSLVDTTTPGRSRTSPATIRVVPISFQASHRIRTMTISGDSSLSTCSDRRGFGLLA